MPPILELEIKLVLQSFILRTYVWLFISKPITRTSLFSFLFQLLIKLALLTGMTGRSRARRASERIALRSFPVGKRGRSPHRVRRSFYRSSYCRRSQCRYRTGRYSVDRWVQSVISHSRELSSSSHLYDLVIARGFSSGG